MSSDQKKVFLSYRRKSSGFEARAVYQHLKHEGYDVFMDVESLDSGRFPDLILRQIEARPHFLVVLVPGSLERTVQADDWLRREIEHALRLNRNVVPLMMLKFTFEDEENRLGGRTLPATIKELTTRSGIPVYTEYFEDAMRRLTGRFMAEGLRISVKPPPAEDVPILKRMDFNATSAKFKASGEWFWSGKTLLHAPTFKAPAGRVLAWTPVPFATGYIVQKSLVSGFQSPIDVYDGTATSFGTDSGIPLKLYYRVKAKGGFAFVDSPWSDSIALKPSADDAWEGAKHLLGRIPRPSTTFLEAPVLEWTGYTCRWTSVPGARGYVVEMSEDRAFSTPVEVYKGAKTEVTAIALAAESFRLRRDLPALTPRYYRVKATSLLKHESVWSNVVADRVFS